MHCGYSLEPSLIKNLYDFDLSKSHLPIYEESFTVDR